MRWLNSEQALGDIAHFHSEMTAKFDLSGVNKWVTWGGSYPGMIAALARYRFPHLIHAVCLVVVLIVNSGVVWMMIVMITIMMMMMMMIVVHDDCS
jgi:pimeloyl-ACP methyl ester carboxylesterase